MKLSKLVLCCALFVAACMPVHAQDAIRCDIPFDFVAGNQSLHAGSYVVTEAFPNSNALWILRGEQGEAVVMTNSTVSPVVERQISLIFRRDGSQFSLIAFWTDAASGRSVVQPRVKDIKVAKSGKPELVQIAAIR